MLKNSFCRFADDWEKRQLWAFQCAKFRRILQKFWELIICEDSRSEVIDSSAFFSMIWSYRLKCINNNSNYVELDNFVVYFRTKINPKLLDYLAVCILRKIRFMIMNEILTMKFRSASMMTKVANQLKPRRESCSRFIEEWDTHHQTTLVEHCGMPVLNVTS